MAVVFRSSSTGPVSASQTDTVIPVPTGVVAGDMLVAMCSGAGPAAGPTPSFVVPAGWVAGTAKIVNVGPSGPAIFQVFWKLATGSEPASYTFSTDVTLGAGSRSMGAVVTAYIGVDPVSPINVTANNGGSNGNQNCPSVTTTISGCLPLRCVGTFANTLVPPFQDTWTAHGGGTLRQQSSPANTLWSSAAIVEDAGPQAIPGSTGAKNENCSRATSTGAGITIALAPSTHLAAAEAMSVTDTVTRTPAVTARAAVDLEHIADVPSRITASTRVAVDHESISEPTQAPQGPTHDVIQALLDLLFALLGILVNFATRTSASSRFAADALSEVDAAIRYVQAFRIVQDAEAIIDLVATRTSATSRVAADAISEIDVVATRTTSTPRVATDLLSISDATHEHIEPPLVFRAAPGAGRHERTLRKVTGSGTLRIAVYLEGEGMVVRDDDEALLLLDA